MIVKLSKRAFLGAGLSALATAAWARAPDVSLRPQLRPVAGAPVAKVASADALIKRAELSGDVAFAVADAGTGQVLESRKPRAGLPPASVTKAVTALYALATLGATHRFYTELVATGPVSGGVLQGDLILKGGGDPSLDTDRMATMAAELKALGLREVKGRFLVDGSALPALKAIDRAQPDHVGYNPSISGIALNFNRVHFEWKRAGGKWTTSMEARSARHRPAVRFAQMSIAARDLPVFSYTAKGGRDAWSVASKALGNGGARWLPVRQPEIYAGEVLRELARAQGVRLPEPQKGSGAGRVLLRQQSAELGSLCGDFMLYSNNLMAEMIGLSATQARRGKAGSLKASAGEMSRWASGALGMSASRFVDHSGLGDASTATAEDMALALVRSRSTIEPLLKRIDLRDENGRLHKNHPVQVRAKTGTLNFVSALAGFARTADGREVSFAIFAADEARRRGIKREDRERPHGARGWNRRAKSLQQALIERWAALYRA